MMLIVTRSTFVAYLIQASAVTIEDLSFLFFLYSVQRQGTTAGSSYGIGRKQRTFGKRKRWQHAIKCNVVFHYNMLLVSRQAGNFAQYDVEPSPFSIFFPFFFLLLFFFFYSLVWQQFITLRNGKRGGRERGSKIILLAFLNDGCRFFVDEEKKWAKNLWTFFLMNIIFVC